MTAFPAFFLSSVSLLWNSSIKEKYYINNKKIIVFIKDKSLNICFISYFVKDFPNPFKTYLWLNNSRITDVLFVQWNSIIVCSRLYYLRPIFSKTYFVTVNLFICQISEIQKFRNYQSLRLTSSNIRSRIS